MTTTLERRGNVAHFARVLEQYDYEELPNGNLLIRDYPVFRAGSFKDSMGELNTWTSQHLQQMVFNFNLLRDEGLFTDVPVRDGHRGFFGGGAPGSGAGRVVGYVQDLRVGDANIDGEPLLVADFEITEEDAANKIRTGTFRARSSEIGFYETNDEALYWPTFVGFAFVDIGAVEKLFEKSTSEVYTPIRDSEDSMTRPSKGGATATGEHEQPPANEETPPEEEETPPAEEEEEETPSVEEQEEEEEEETPPTTATHSAGGVHAFTIGGSQTTDFAAVQAHIDNLEGTLEEFNEHSRRAFVEQLAENGIIGAPQVDAMAEHAVGLTVEQYNQFTEMWEAASPNPTFGRQPGGTTNQDGTSGTTSPDESTEESDLKERVEFARKSGVSEEDLKKMDSYIKLKALQDAKSDES